LAAQAAAMTGDLRMAVLGLERCRAVCCSARRSSAVRRPCGSSGAAGRPELAARFAAATDRVTVLTRA